MDFYTNLKIDTDKLRLNAQLAGALLHQKKLIVNDFCEDFKGLDIIIRADKDWSCDKSECFGVTNVVPIYVETDRNTEALLHELIHVIELRNGSTGTWRHEGWELKGYHALQSTYVKEMHLIGPD
jgi:hypothetical protein